MRSTFAAAEFHLAEPFVTARGALTTVRQILLELTWDGLTGVGVAHLADREGWGEEAVRASLQTALRQIAGRTPADAASLLNRLETGTPAACSAASAVDMAVHDLLGQVAGLPLRRLWRLPEEPAAPTAISLGADDGRLLQQRAMELIRWPVIKVKMTPGDDANRVAMLRDMYPGRIWVDGNGCWDRRGAIAMAEKLHGYGVELLEQPVPAGNPDVVRAVRAASPIPVVADEDCCTPLDVLRLRGCVDVVNIKLFRCGGLLRALRMIRLARRAGLRVMLGCKTESAVGVTAMAQLAGLADYLDLDGHLDLLDDPYRGIAVETGHLRLPTTPGLGLVRVSDAEGGGAARRPAPAAASKGLR
ncbi:MAG TPA: enolase C-terminal domain-like protein [Nakamurella sp.]